MADEPKDHDIVPPPYSALVKGGLRSIAALFPWFAPAGQAWNEYETYRTARRIQELFDNLRAELETMKDAVAEHADRLKHQDDFPELLEIAIEKVRREFDEAKRARYARLLARFLADGQARSHDKKVALLESLDLLSETDLGVLALFQGKEVAEIGDLRWRELGLPGDANEQLWTMFYSLARLGSRGLVLKVAQIASTYIPLGSPLTADATRWERTQYRVLPLGKSLIEVLFD